MEFNSIQKYQKYKNKYLNLKNMNKINNNNITYFKQHGSGLLDECRNSGIYMIVGGKNLKTAYESYINPLTYSVIGIRKDITSCEFFKQFNSFYKLKSDSSTLIQIIDSKEAEEKAAAERKVATVAADQTAREVAIREAKIVAAKSEAAAAEAAEAAKVAKVAEAEVTAAKVAASQATEAAANAKLAAEAAEKKATDTAANPKPNKLKLTSSYNFKDFIEKLDDVQMSVAGNGRDNYIIKFPEYRNFCNLLVNIYTIFDNFSTDNLENYITYRKSNKEPTKAQQIMSILNIKKYSKDSSPTLDIGVIDDKIIMNLEKIYNYFKDSEINNFKNAKSLKSFKWYFFIEFSITTSKIISVGGIKEVNEQTGLPVLYA